MLDIQYGFYQTHLKVGILYTMSDIFMIYWNFIGPEHEAIIQCT